MEVETNSDRPKFSSHRMTIALICIALLVAVSSSLPQVQSFFRNSLAQPNRHILAKITGYYGLTQNEFLIFKIKDGSGLQIEIYEINKETSQQIFKQKFELAQDTDAYITLDKNTTNLALSDLDKDGNLDLLAPSVDRNGNLRLNSFRFNSALNLFEPMQETNSTF